MRLGIMYIYIYIILCNITIIIIIYNVVRIILRDPMMVILYVTMIKKSLYRYTCLIIGRRMKIL